MRQSGACVSSTFPSLSIVSRPLHPRQQLTAVMVFHNHRLNSSTPTPLPRACVPATTGAHAALLVYIYIYIANRLRYGIGTYIRSILMLVASVGCVPGPCGGALGIFKSPVGTYDKMKHAPFFIRLTLFSLLEHA